MADVDHSEADKEELPDFLQNQYHTKKFEKYSPEYKFMSSRLFFNAFIFIAAVSAAVLVDTVSSWWRPFDQLTCCTDA